MWSWCVYYEILASYPEKGNKNKKKMVGEILIY